MDQSHNEPGYSGGATTGVGEDALRGEASASPGLREKARESVRDAREQVMSQVRERADSARQGATRMVDERKRTLADSVHAIASAFDAAAASLTEGNQGRLAELTRELSGRAHRIASYLEQQDTGGLVTDLESTARRHPTAFVGSSFAAGLAAGRFLRSSARANETRLSGDQPVDFEFVPDDALVSGDTGGTTSFSASGYGNPGSGYGQTGSSLGATRSGPGDAGFGPTRTGSLGGMTGAGHIGTGGAALASRAAGSEPSGQGTGGLRTSESDLDLNSTNPEDALRATELTGDSGLGARGRSTGGTATDSGTNSDASSNPQRPTGGFGEGGL